MQPIPMQADHHARQRAEHWLLRSVAVLRIAQFAAPLPTLFGEPFAYPRSAGIVAFSVCGLWSALLFGVSLHRNMISIWYAVADAVVLSAGTVVLGLCLQAENATWYHWLFGPSIGATIVCTVFLPYRFAVPLSALIVASGLVGGWISTAPSPDHPSWPSALSGAGSMIAFTAMAGWGTRLLRSTATQVDQATATAVAASQREADAQARFDERSQQYRLLHDTVLHTLSKIARGGLDHRTPEIRDLCARDAAYLRNLITGSDHHIPTTAAAALADLAREHTAFGLQVHCQFHALPGSLPNEVATAMTNATREALNNIAKHAHVDQAWLTAVGIHPDGLCLTIADRGIGFDQTTTDEGTGLTHSVRRRVEEVGGEVIIDSAPGHGTMVELRWTR